MKKIIISLLILISLNVSASTNTFERTEEDLRINDWITVTEENKQHILNTPSVLETEHIYDFADLLSEEEETSLLNEVNKYIETYFMDMVIVTTKENSYTAEEYADDFYDYNNFGIGNNRAGILILIDMLNREFYISTTGEAILLYNDNRIDSILDDMTYDMKNANYYKALKISINKASDYASEGIPEENKNSYIDEFGNYVYVEPDKPYPLVLFLIISVSVATIILVIFVKKNKLVRKAYEATSYMKEDTKEINIIRNTFLTSHTSRVYIPSSSGSSGSSSGGSSTHSSSSGASHGGGGRGF